MAVFQHPFWAYELTLPDSWVHGASGGSDVFAAVPEALNAEFSGPQAGQLLVRGEWNYARKDIEPLWQEHIAKLASILGAKQVGSAPWRMGSAVGLEAEIQLPVRTNRRLWTGILRREFTVLHFMVIHPPETGPFFEPPATQTISSLRFINEVRSSTLNDRGLPIPLGYEATDPRQVVADIQQPENWRGYQGPADIGALQAFYLREAPNYGWIVQEYIPLPNQHDLGFARLGLRKGPLQVTLGIMPASSGAQLIFRYH
jgi:hypothetical protein